MSAAARRPSSSAALRAHYRAVQARLTTAAPLGSASPESPATPQAGSAPAVPVEVMVFSRTGWEAALAELNERLRALFAIGRVGEHELIDLVAAHFRLTRAEIVGARGTSRVAQARHIAMYMCRREFGTSASALGSLFRRDHTSVAYAAQKVAARIAKDAAFAAEVAALAARWQERRG